MGFTLQRLSFQASLLIAGLAGLLPLAAQPLPTTLEDTLAFYCYDCHDDSITKGGLDLTNTPFDLNSKHHFETWSHIYDRVKQGEMPPKKKDQPSSEERTLFLTLLKNELDQTDRSKIKKEGRVHSRRLTRTEYEHSLHDLLGIRIPLKKLLPADESGHSFETLADTQQLSHFHLNKYLEAADQALEQALKLAQHGSEDYHQHHNAWELTRFINSSPGNYRGPQLIDGKVHSWARSIAFNGRMRSTRVPEPGWYRITIKNLHGINPGPDQTVWGTLNIGVAEASAPLETLAATVEATAEPKDLVVDTWMNAKEGLILKPNEGTNEQIPFKFGSTRNRNKRVAYWKDRNLTELGFPAIVFESITIKRIHPGGTQEHLRNLLIPGIEFENNQPLLEQPDQDLSRLITHFANRTFRRPTSRAQVQPYLDLALARFNETNDLFQALHESYRAILCSPRFLTFVEPPGTLDNHAIATRLSYLLWSSIPDNTLRTLAKKGQLKDPKILTQQINRLLAHPKSERFINNFTDQWLDLKNIDFTTPDKRRFWAFDPVLRDSMLQETRAFVRELIDQDLSVRNFIRSDFAFLNTRLNTHYQLDNHVGTPVLPGKGLQKIPLDNSYRSGLITQGSVLKVTADGSVTSPILRGVWVGERILGTHIAPPPDNIPAIEPDIRGATSIRDQLEKHKASESCASCHIKIDPPGLALENFDPTGQWRNYYGRDEDSALVDPSGQTPDGKTFQNIGEWKDIYHAQPELLARAFTNHILAYGTGAKPRFSDRETVEKIIQKTKASDYGLRSLLEASLTSEIFLTK